MAKYSRTQLRLGQLTGSFGDANGKIRDQVDALASGSIVVDDLSGSLSYMASAIRRLGGGFDFSGQKRGHFGAGPTAASAESGPGGYNFHVTGSTFATGVIAPVLPT